MTERGEEEIRKLAVTLEAQISLIAAKAEEAAELLRRKVTPIQGAAPEDDSRES